MKRDDVHHHVEWEGYVSKLRSEGINSSHGSGFPEWSPAKSLEIMDRNDIGAAIVGFLSRRVLQGNLLRRRAGENL